MLDNGHLQIRGIKKTDEGVYNCEARVAARGEIDYKKITVVVNGESQVVRDSAVSGPSTPTLTRHLPCVSVFPTVRVRQSEVNATADIGSSTMLACDADGFPDPVVTWAQYVSLGCRRFALQDENSQQEQSQPLLRGGAQDPSRVFYPTGRPRSNLGLHFPRRQQVPPGRTENPGWIMGYRRK